MNEKQSKKFTGGRVMSGKQYELYFLFSFILKDINFPLNIKGVRIINQQINNKGEKHLEIQCGEHWKDISVARRFLWLFSPHIHYRPLSANLVDTLKSLFEKEINIANCEIRISTVFGGGSLAELKMTLSGDFQKVVDTIDLLTGKNIGFDKNHNLVKHDEARKINKLFVTEINNYVDKLNEIDQLKFNNKGKEEKIKWNEYAEDGKFDYCAGITENGYDIFSSEKEIFYQEPYIILVAKHNIMEEQLDYFLGYGITGKEPLLNRAEIKISDKVSLWADPTKMLIQFNETADTDIQEEILQVVHRVLFLLRTKAHFCLLWDSKIQSLYKKLHEILRGLVNKDTNYIEKLKEITELSLILAEWSGEIFSAFIWRYSAFLSSAKGYLAEFYRKLDTVMTTHLKSEDLRNSVNEIRNQLEFTGNILRDLAATKYAERFNQEV